MRCIRNSRRSGFLASLAVAGLLVVQHPLGVAAGSIVARPALNTTLTQSQGGVEIISGANTAQCLDADSNNLSNANGDPVQLWQCNGAANQDWQPVFLGFSPLGFELFEFINQANGWCLDARSQGGYVNGNPVQGYPCNGNANQIWEFEFVFDPTTLSAAPSFANGANLNLCLDASSQQGYTNGDPVQLFTCNGAANQSWSPAPQQSLT